MIFYVSVPTLCEGPVGIFGIGALVRVVYFCGCCVRGAAARGRGQQQGRLAACCGKRLVEALSDPLIMELIAKLQQEAESEATEKAYCDEELAKTSAKKGELEGVISRLTSMIDLAAAKSAELKSEVKTFSAELAALAKQQAEMDSVRAEEKAAYDTAKAELQLGIDGVGKALGVAFHQQIADRVEGTRKVSSHKTSTLQDLEAGRPMEVDGITGAVVELGRLTGVETPMIDLTYALLRQRARESGLYPEINFDPLAATAD